MHFEVENKKRFYLAAFVFLFLILFGRFAQLQLYEWDKYYRQSERNRIREVTLDAPRGLLLDRHGKVLVDNRPAYTLSVVPYELFNSDSSLTLLSSIVHMGRTELVKTINKNKIGRFTPVKVKRQIGFEVLSRIEEHKLELPGVLYEVESKRYYPAGIKAPHLFGYVGEITSDELAKRRGEGFKSGDLIGKNGIELSYENELRGEAGVKYVEVDVLGREIRDISELSSKQPVPGDNLYLTLDWQVQKYLEDSLEGKKGAAVVLDPRNGEILAMVSKPDYDPEIFSNPLTNEIWNQLVMEEGKPLYNRACQSLYPPGSTFKVVLAAAALETGLIDPERKVFCPGFYRLGRRNFVCWRKGGHGEVNMLQAIEQSCNVYFYTISLEVGLSNWAKYAKLFNFGKSTGLDLPNESAGLVPNKVYFDGKYGEKGWTKGLLLNLAVGQGDLLATPLQMAYLAMVLANNGVAFEPHLVKEKEDPITGELATIAPDSIRVNHISSATYDLIKQGMFNVVNGPHGTGYAAALPKIKVCGKTGTAQNPHGKDHAWFIGFAPMEDPRVAFCILVENGGGGGAVAAPIAHGMLAILFNEDQTVFAENKTQLH